MSTASLRAATTRKLAGLELPDCFGAATEASTAKLLAKRPSERTAADRRDLRRLSDKSRRIERAVMSDWSIDAVLEEASK